ncbi:hypothetical protein [Stutzerimonas stutzeri]|uniref:hypothetical protein n=1 Tax=Stutzerimonas stutzeri TaxID=316 RepID=UPI003B7E967B
MYGFSALGTDNRLIINDSSPILTQMYRGKLTVNTLPRNPKGALMGRGYGYCEVTYPYPVETREPPLVFGIPTPRCANKGIGVFTHRGRPGGWIGFCVLITGALFANNYSAMQMGFDSGWEYSVCGFGLAGDAGYAEYGMRLFGPTGKVIYDSAWPVVQFRGLLQAWTLSDFTRGYAMGYYWGNRDVSGDEDQVLAKGYHAWGVPDGSQGILIASIGRIGTSLDVGNYNKKVAAAVTVGFPDAGRDNLWSVAFFGLAQHPSGDVRDLNRWRMLIADFSQTKGAA